MDKKVRKLYPGGKAKAFNITYDDGVTQDVRFVALLNRYGLKGTFNLNSQLAREGFVWTHENGMQVKRLPLDKAMINYRGHEIGSHTLVHPSLGDLPDAEIKRQMRSDKADLEATFGVEVKGFAVPFSYFGENCERIARQSGFEYARISEFSLSYKPCAEYFRWKTGVYHIMPELVPFVDGFFETDEELAVCQIVGHSYDLDALHLWDIMEDICRKVSKSTDVWSCTNLELVRYLKAMEQAEITGDALINHSETELWFLVGGKTVKLAPGEAITL